jgi:hypothetical protein
MGSVGVQRRVQPRSAPPGSSGPIASSTRLIHGHPPQLLGVEHQVDLDDAVAAPEHALRDLLGALDRRRTPRPAPPPSARKTTSGRRSCSPWFMYGVAETVASRMAQQEEYIADTPAIAILPWFFAGALFPIGALPAALTEFAKFLPLTHALALMRYGLVDPDGSGLNDIWGMSSTTAEAWLSLGVVLLFAGAFAALAVRSFTRAEVR